REALRFPVDVSTVPAAYIQHMDDRFGRADFPDAAVRGGVNVPRGGRAWNGPYPNEHGELMAQIIGNRPRRAARRGRVSILLPAPTRARRSYGQPATGRDAKASRRGTSIPRGPDPVSRAERFATTTGRRRVYPTVAGKPTQRYCPSRIVDELPRSRGTPSLRGPLSSPACGGDNGGRKSMDKSLAR